MWQKWMGLKDVIVQVTYFLNGSMVNSFFCCHITLYWEEETCFEKVTLEIQISEKFQHFNAIDGISKCWKIIKCSKFQLKWKISEHFTRPK